MVTAVGRSAVADAAEGMRGFPVALTSFVGRAQAVTEIADRLSQCRLVTVTVTGPGGAGKTRLVGEVARRVAAPYTATRQRPMSPTPHDCRQREHLGASAIMA
jgi:hypothetical protein